MASGATALDLRLVDSQQPQTPLSKEKNGFVWPEQVIPWN